MTAIPRGAASPDVRLDGGFPDADDDIVRFVLEDMSKEMRLTATSSPVLADSPTNVPPSIGMAPPSKPSASPLPPPPTTSDLADTPPINTTVVDHQISAAVASGKPKLEVATHQPATSPQCVEEDKAEGKPAETELVEENEAKKRLAEANLRATLAWNHAMAVSLLQASFERCMFFTNGRNRRRLTYSSYRLG